VIKYKKVVTKDGRTMFFENGKMVSDSRIPQSILKNLEDGVEISINTPDPETVDETPSTAPQLDSNKNVCIFCGDESSKTKFLNLQTVHLCEEDYQNHTVGEIVSRVKTTPIGIK